MAPLWQWVAATVLAGGGLVGIYWKVWGLHGRLTRLEQQVVEHGEHFARIEGRMNGLHREWRASEAALVHRTEEVDRALAGLQPRVHEAEKKAAAATPQKLCDDRHGRQSPPPDDVSDSQDAPFSGRRR